MHLNHIHPYKHPLGSTSTVIPSSSPSKNRRLQTGAEWSAEPPEPSEMGWIWALAELIGGNLSSLPNSRGYLRPSQGSKLSQLLHIPSIMFKTGGFLFLLAGDKPGHSCTSTFERRTQKWIQKSPRICGSSLSEICTSGAEQRVSLCTARLWVYLEICHTSFHGQAQQRGASSPRDEHRAADQEHTVWQWAPCTSQRAGPGAGSVDEAGSAQLLPTAPARALGWVTLLGKAKIKPSTNGDVKTPNAMAGGGGWQDEG